MACVTLQEADRESAGGRKEGEDNRFIRYQAQGTVEKIQQSSCFSLFPLIFHAELLQTHLEIQTPASAFFTFHSHFTHGIIMWQAFLQS